MPISSRPATAAGITVAIPTTTVDAIVSKKSLDPITTIKSNTKKMDYSSNGLSSYPSPYASASTTAGGGAGRGVPPSTTTGTTTTATSNQSPQKVTTLRHRCRSECHQLSPPHQLNSGLAGNEAKQQQPNLDQHHLHDLKHKSQSYLRNGYHHHQHSHHSHGHGHHQQHNKYSPPPVNLGVNLRQNFNHQHYNNHQDNNMNSMTSGINNGGSSNSNGGPNNRKLLLPLDQQHVTRKLALGKDNIKENISSSEPQLIAQADILNKGPEITDLREVYLKDKDVYEEKMRHQHLINHMNGKLIVEQQQQQPQTQAQNHHQQTIQQKDQVSTLKDDKKINATNKRKTRQRSESDPHEVIYERSIDTDKNKFSNVVLKRSRDEGIILPKPNGTHHNGNSRISPSKCDKGLISPPPKVNPNHSSLVNLSAVSIATAMSGKLTSPLASSSSSIGNGTATDKQKSITKPIAVISSTIRPSKKLPSPQPLNTATLKVSDVIAAKKLMNVTMPSVVVANGQKNDAESDISDTECSSLDDDNEDYGDLGEDAFDSMTDSEDSYKIDANTAPSTRNDNKIIQPPSISESVVGSYSPLGPISPSLFPHVPPFLTFATHTEPGPKMHPLVSKILKWKLTAVTPIVVRKVLINSGFRLLRQTNDWMGIWGKHMKSPQFRTIRSYQKFNHLPGTFQIGRKDRVWRNLQNQMSRNGKKEFGFMPRTYILPHDLKILRQMWPRYSQRDVKWIIKPPASARGTGIKVVNRWSQIPKKRPIIVQRYIERPMLINGSKFDLRLYVLVTSVNPLRIYMHTDGLARFASVRYSEKSDTLNDRYMHLTNYSINKLSANYTKNEDAAACKGHKWTIKSLWSYLETIGINTNRLWGTLRNLVIRTILAGENSIHTMAKAHMASKYNCYELFGFDVLLDADLVPWLLEVNISPSLHSASPLDLHVKAPLVQATFNTALYQVPPKLSVDKQEDILNELGLKGPLCHDKKLYTTVLSRTERMKHNEFTNRDISREEYLDSILEMLTPDDVRCLITTEEELSRCAPLERIFPAPNTHKYLCYTDSPRYYNRLLDAWENRYGTKRDEGIKYLQELCAQKIHLQVPPNTVRKDSNNKNINGSGGSDAQLNEANNSGSNYHRETTTTATEDTDRELSEESIIDNSQEKLELLNNTMNGAIPKANSPAKILTTDDINNCIGLQQIM